MEEITRMAGRKINLIEREKVKTKALGRNPRRGGNPAREKRLIKNRGLIRDNEGVKLIFCREIKLSCDRIIIKVKVIKEYEIKYSHQIFSLRVVIKAIHDRWAIDE
jgi:hypothetical protein